MVGDWDGLISNFGPITWYRHLADCQPSSSFIFLKCSHGGNPSAYFHRVLGVFSELSHPKYLICKLPGA